MKYVEKVDVRDEHHVVTHYARRHGKLTKIRGYERHQHQHWQVCPHCGKQVG